MLSLTKERCLSINQNEVYVECENEVKKFTEGFSTGKSSH